MRSAITQRNLQFGLDFTCKKIAFLLMVLFCLFILIFANNVKAQGVAAGTNIFNRVTINYKISGINQLPIESTTDFVVDRKIDLSITGNTNANVVPGDTQEVVTFTLENEGNDNQEFSLIPDPTIASDDFNPDNCTYEVTAVSGTPLSGVVIPTSANIKLKPDQQASINVKCDIPLTYAGSPIIDGQSAIISLVATAENNDDGSITSESVGSDISSTVQTVFVDTAGSDDANRDASHSARRNYLVSSSGTPATLSINKSIVSIIDSLGGNTPVSGAEVTYQIQITTAGTGFVNNLVVTDPTPASMNYKTESIKLDNTNQSDANDGADSTDFGITTANTATINLGNIAAGSSREIQLTYIIN